MWKMQDLSRRAVTTKVGMAAAVILAVGGGAAIAAPGVGPTDEASETEVFEELAAVQADVHATLDAACDSGPDTSFCRAGSDDDDGGDPDAEPEKDGGLAAPGDTDSFSAWVRSVPTDWGCIRGHLISHIARGAGPHGEGLPELGSAWEVAEELGIGDRRCAQVAIARAGGGTERAELESEEVVGTAGKPVRAEAEGTPGAAGKPDHAGTPGRPAHAGTSDKPDHAGTSGKPDHAGTKDPAATPAPAPANGRGRGR